MFKEQIEKSPQSPKSFLVYCLRLGEWDKELKAKLYIGLFQDNVPEKGEQKGLRLIKGSNRELNSERKWKSNRDTITH